MIQKLTVKNYALLKDVSIEFKQRLTVISGETGSGKSILIDALALLLGKRVERLFTEEDQKKTIIEALFIIDKSKEYFFIKNDIDFNECTIVRREINTTGKSRAFINDTPVLLNILTEFAKQIIEIHSQHETIFLKDEIFQFQFIDQVADSSKELKQYQNALNKYNHLKNELDQIKKSGSFSASELELLQYHLSELNSAEIKVGEKEEIEKQLSLLENIDAIKNIADESEHIFNKEEGILSLLALVKRRLLEHDTFDELATRMDSLLIELNDINTELDIINHTLEGKPENLLLLNNRLDLLNGLLQKHKKQFIEELIELRNEIEQKINNSSSFEIQLRTKQEEINEQRDKLTTKCRSLNIKRNKSLPRIKDKIETHLGKLGMPFAKFLIQLTETEVFHHFGNTNVQFLFSANKGRPMQDFSKIASGGELSRLMLTIKYITAQLSKVNTLIFDEIDSGVSGEIASLMGDMMKKISQENQLIAISHLPQIASKADYHFKVTKEIKRETTISDVVLLNNQQRLEELAKLLSGKQVTNAAFENAKALLSQ